MGECICGSLMRSQSDPTIRMAVQVDNVFIEHWRYQVQQGRTKDVSVRARIGWILVWR